MTMTDAWRAWRPWLAARAGELEASLAFLTRLPLTRSAARANGAIAQAAWAFPTAGIVVGLLGALVYALARRSGLPAWPAAGLTLMATLALTGCLHEDGLADTMDGFGGGRTREHKLAIMRDSRIGSYGVCALVVSLLLRTAALASLDDPAAVAPALIAAHAGARATMPLMMYFAPPARSEGLSFAAGQPSPEAVAGAAAIGILVLVGCLGPALAAGAAILLAIVVVLAVWLSLWQIGGQTGDVIGALEQASEIVILLVALR